MLRMILIAVALAVGAVPAFAADRVVNLPPGSPWAGTVRIGEPTGGPSLREVAPADISAVVFTGEGDDAPVNGWFNRTTTAALKKNGLWARKPEAARYMLTADVQSMAITPLATGSRHRSIVIYRLKDAATGRQLWEKAHDLDFEVERGIRFGKIGGAMGGALGGALAGQDPAVTAAMIGFGGSKVRPFDIRIDIYEGIMRGFQRMAETTIQSLTALDPAGLPAGASPAE
jgi:hypothetical protein